MKRFSVLFVSWMNSFNFIYRAIWWGWFFFTRCSSTLEYFRYNPLLFHSRTRPRSKTMATSAPRDSKTRSSHRLSKVENNERSEERCCHATAATPRTSLFSAVPNRIFKRTRFVFIFASEVIREKKSHGVS